MLKNGEEKCSCPRKACERNGKCDECSAHHGKNLTYCERKLRRQLKAKKPQASE